MSFLSGLPSMLLSCHATYQGHGIPGGQAANWQQVAGNMHVLLMNFI